MNKTVVFFVGLLLAACSSDPVIENKSDEVVESSIVSVEKDPVLDNAPSQTEETETPIAPASNFSVKVFEHELGWGYQIFDGTTMVINQKHIPSVQGIKAFSSQEKAQIAADFVQQQIEAGNFPPTVSPRVLDSLGVLD